MKKSNRPSRSMATKSALAIEALQQAARDINSVRAIRLSYTKAGATEPAVYVITRGEDCLSGTNWDMTIQEETLVSGEKCFYLQGLCYKKNREVVLEKRKFKLEPSRVEEVKLMMK
jgi:hypothetical protein